MAPVLLTLHQALPDEEIDPESILGKLLSTADWVTACSDAVLCHAAELAPKIRSRSSTIHNALERPKIGRRPLPFDPPQLLFLGRLVPEKGLDWALAAFPSIFHRFPSARLIVAGEGPDMEELKAKADSLGLARWVEFIGGVPPQSVPHLINHATVVVMPSRVEGFGLVALEAAMMGRPVVGVQVGGLPEVVSDGKTGFLVKSCDTDAFVKAVSRLLGDPDTAKQFGDAACKRAQEVFDWKRYVESYDALYRQLAT